MPEETVQVENTFGDYEYFKNKIFELTDINLHAYKEKQMKRRINTYITRHAYKDYETFIAKLKEDKNELEHFVEYLTINVSEFFRTPEHWKYFENNVIPRLVEQTDHPLRIWSCACSTGEEPYSIVMSLARYTPLENIHVLATDLDIQILEKAALGIYSSKTMQTVPEEYRKAYFTCKEDGWHISEAIRNCVEFCRLDLIIDTFPERVDLIICRNVLIYFTEDTKNSLYKQFYDCLTKGGYLFTGNTEQIIQYKSLGFVKEKNYIYQKQ